MKPVKVLFYYSSTHADTGSPRIMLRMIDALDPARYRPLFLAAGEGSLVDELRARDVPILPGEVTSVSWRHPLELLRGVSRQRRLLRDEQVGLVHMNEPGWNSDLVLAARLQGIPVALHLHNAATVSPHNLNYRIASKVFLCSAALRTAVKNVAAIETKCVTLHNAVDVAAFATGQSIRASLGIADDDITIGTIAQVGPIKGSDTFLDTGLRLLERGMKVKLVVVGPKASGEDAFFERFKARIAESPLREHVIYLGSRRDIPDILASLDIFFLPTRSEPFGMVVIEAMAAGVPVVTSHVGGIPEIITDPAIGRTVAPQTAEAFAQAITELVAMGDGRRTIGERGRRSLAGRFDLASMGATLERTYGDMLEQRPAGSEA